MLLSAFGILFVIDAHSWNGIGFFSSLFPYDSFFMPMFVFISGYFFKDRHISSFSTLLKYIKNKFFRLFFPFLLWVIFYGILVHAAKYFNIILWEPLPWSELPENIYKVGTTFNVNGAAWFVPMLFSVVVIYALLRKCLHRIWNDIAAAILLIGIGTYCVYIATHGFDKDYVLLLKIGFFMQFYQLGVVFAKYLEKGFDQLHILTVCLVCILINAVLIFIYKDITFKRCANMSGFHSDQLLIPLLTSVTGIAFWLKISKWLTPMMKDNRIIQYISDNTFFIMIHHLAVINVFHAILWYMKKWGVTALVDFNTFEFRSSPWYIYAASPGIKAICFVFTVVVTVGLCFLFEQLKKWEKSIKNPQQPLRRMGLFHDPSYFI